LKTYTVKCKDGSKKTVYKKINDAFPLYIPGWKGSINASGNYINQINANVKSEYSSMIQGLLYSLDDLNQGLMLQFVGVYNVYKSDPCKHDSFLEREVTKLLEEQRRLLELKVQVDGLIRLASSFPNNSDDFVKIYSNIIEKMKTSQLPQVTANQIDESKQIMKELVGTKDEK
jgi:hypothetical protein